MSTEYSTCQIRNRPSSSWHRNLQNDHISIWSPSKYIRKTVRISPCEEGHKAAFSSTKKLKNFFCILPDQSRKKPYKPAAKKPNQNHNQTQTNQKLHRNLQTEQYIFEWTVVHGRNWRENEKFSRNNENSSTVYENLWHIARASPRGKGLAGSTHTRAMHFRRQNQPQWRGRNNKDVDRK